MQGMILCLYGFGKLLILSLLFLLDRCHDLDYREVFYNFRFFTSRNMLCRQNKIYYWNYSLVCIAFHNLRVYVFCGSHNLGVMAVFPPNFPQSDTSGQWLCVQYYLAPLLAATSFLRTVRSRYFQQFSSYQHGLNSFKCHHQST